MKKTGRSALVLLLVLSMLLGMFSMTALAAEAAPGDGSAATPFQITSEVITAFYSGDSKYNLAYNNGTSQFSASYVKGTGGGTDIKTQYNITISELDIVNEYAILTCQFWNGDMPAANALANVVISGGKLAIKGAVSNLVSGNDTSMGNTLNVRNATGKTYVKGEFDSIEGKVYQAGELVTGGNVVVIGEKQEKDENHPEKIGPYDLVITSGTAQISGYFKSLTVRPGAKVIVTGDTAISDGFDTVHSMEGELTVKKGVTLDIDSVSVKPEADLAFDDSTMPWGTLQAGSYAAAAGKWSLNGDVTLKYAGCIPATEGFDLKDEPFVMNESSSFVLSALDGTVKAVSGTVKGEGNKVTLKLASEKEGEEVFASGAFKEIQFDEKTMTVLKDQPISAYVGTDLYGATPKQDTVFDHFGGELPKSETATPYEYVAVTGPWSMQAGTGDVVNGAGADLTVTEDGVLISGEFNTLNTGSYTAILGGDTVIHGGTYNVKGESSQPYTLTVTGGDATVSGAMQKLIVEGGTVQDAEAAALTIRSSATAIEVTGGTLTFRNADTAVLVDGSANAIAANISGGDFYQLKGSIEAQGDSSRTIYVTGTGRYHLGAEDNTEAYSSANAPSVKSYGEKSACVYANAGGEAWLHAGEVSFNSRGSYGIWANKDGIVHVYPNDQYGSDITATDALLYVHGDSIASAAMWVDTLGTFDIRGRGALLEEPSEGGYALYIHESASLTIAEPLSGGSFDGCVFWKNNDLSSLLPANHYLRFDGAAAVWGTTDGTFGICPEAANSEAEQIGSYAQLHDSSAGTYAAEFGSLGTVYTVTDAEWELRWNLANGLDYQIPAGLAADSGVITADANVYNAETVKGSIYLPLWGVSHKQGDVNAEAASVLYLAGRELTYTGKNAAGTALSALDTAWAGYDGDLCTVRVAAAGSLTVTDAAADEAGAAFSAESFLGTGVISYLPDTDAETAGIISAGSLNLAAGTVCAENGLQSSGVVLTSGTAVFGLTDEDSATEYLTVLGGIVDKSETKLSQAVKVLDADLTVNGGTIGMTGSETAFGGENGINILDGTLTVNGGIIAGNWAQGKGIRVADGSVTVLGGCIYGDYAKAAKQADMSVLVNGGSVILNIDEAHKTFTADAQAAGKTAGVHHLNNVRITDGSLVIGADAAGTVTPYTYLNGTLTCLGGTTVFRDGAVMGDTTVYGATSGSLFTTEFFVENGSFGNLTVQNGSGNTESYTMLTGADDDFQEKVQIHGGTFARIDVSALKLKNKPSTVQNLVAAWTKAYDFDANGSADWAPFNHYAETVADTRGADGFWAPVAELQSGKAESGAIVGGQDGKAVVIRWAPDEIARWAAAGGDYTLNVNIWYGERPAEICSLFECEGTESTAAPLRIAKNAALHMNAFGLFTDRAEALITVNGGELTLDASAAGTAAYANLLRNFSKESAAIGIDVAEGSLILTGAAGAYPTAGAVTAVRSADTVDVQQGILLANYGPECTAGLIANSGTVHLGDAVVTGQTVGVLMNNGSLTVDDNAELSSLQMMGASKADMTAGSVTGTTLIETTGTVNASGTADFTGLITQKNGTLNFAATAKELLQTAGTLNMTGGTLDSADVSGIANVSGGNVGSLTQTAGTAAVSGGSVDDLLQKAGTLTISGGSVTALGQTGGTLNMNGGLVAKADTAGTVMMKAGEISELESSGSLTVNGGTLPKLKTAGTSVLNAGTIGDVTESAGNLTMANVDAGNLAVDGGAALVNGGSLAAVSQTDGELTLATTRIASLNQAAGTADLLNVTASGKVETSGTVTVTGGSYQDFEQKAGTADLKSGTFQSIKAADKLADIITGLILDNLYPANQLEDQDYFIANYAELKSGDYADVDGEGTSVTMVAPFTLRPKNGGSTGGGSTGGGGGGGAAPVSTYEIKADPEPENGTVGFSKEKAAAGTEIIITVTPDKGWTPEIISAKDESGEEIELTNNEDGTWTFEMPASEVKVEVTFMEDNTMLNFFVDVPADTYYYDAVLWAVENGITTGTDETHFSPEAPTTRAQMVTFLWRAAGSPVVNFAMSFADVEEDAWYTEAVRWAASEGITKGYSETQFGTNDTVTRAQTVTFLARMAGMKESEVEESLFTDVPAGEFYSGAVAWAVENGITNGTGDGSTFSPEADCLRGQIVTFLYRCFGE